MNNTPNKQDCGTGRCAPINRRDFLKAAGLTATGALTAGLPVMAGPFKESDFEKLIPADKKLDPDWVKSLFARDSRTVYRNKELKYIGMPVGGICAGHLYIAGDGKLWLWDIFNRFYKGVAGKGSRGENYVNPLEPASPLDQGFAIRLTSKGDSQLRTLDRAGFSDISFCGEYPIATVDYRDDQAPVEVTLKAYSPFTPLNALDSGMPATVMQYVVRNTSGDDVKVELAGWLENATCLYSANQSQGIRRNSIIRHDGLTLLNCTTEEQTEKARQSVRPDILFEDFEEPTYENWQTTGTAFGKGPIEKAKMPQYQGDVGSRGKFLVNSHNTRQGEDVRAGDAHVGTLTSRDFTVERNYINFLIGGGDHKGETCVNLIIDGKIVRTATGKNDNRMQPHSFDVRDLQGKTAGLQVVDNYSGGWGNIGIDHIVFSDKPRESPIKLSEQPDFGTMALALLKSTEEDRACPSISDGKFLETLFSAKGGEACPTTAAKPFGTKLKGALGRAFTLRPGATATVTFVVCWHFPNLRLQGFGSVVGRYYANWFFSAEEVAVCISTHFDSLSRQTQLWHDTWYDSTLPYWFLDRTFVNISTLATSTAYRFRDGRFYGWEGVGCCQGTCTHVWHYAQAVARIFPELERDLRRRTDYGIAFNSETGAIGHRGEFARSAADDGQAGAILRTYREHQMSPDSTFLKRSWNNVKKAVTYLINKDSDSDGMVEGAQPNTLDAAWYGKIAWLNSLYLAALRAAEAMALEVGDTAFAEQTRKIFDRGREQLVKLLFNGEYFIQIPDLEHMDAIGADTGCYIDQVFGQGWAFQVGLGRLYSEKHIKSALRSLWKYNFTPDVGPFKEVYKKGRPYALAGDAGMIMCTWPKGGKRKDWEKHWQFGYFNECMTGFEYQVAGHMLWEGMLKEGLAVTRAIHDRYHARLRNPFNEIECSDHYARAMASYGVFLAACGYEYHGPKGHLAFAPKLTPENFRAAFTAAEGWGTFGQKRTGKTQQETITIKWGRLRLRTLAFEVSESCPVGNVKVTADGRAVQAPFKRTGNRVDITLDSDTSITTGQSIEVLLS